MVSWWEYAVASAAMLGMASSCTGEIRAQGQQDPVSRMADLTTQAKGIVSGPARVIDGDTIEIRRGTQKHRVRIHGIDAPEMDQTCLFDTPMGWMARTKLIELTDGYHVDCFILTTDKFKRDIGYCHAAGKDLAEEMVHTGHAFAFYRYTARYWDVEDMAIADNLGVHKYKCDKPWFWREHNPKR